MEKCCATCTRVYVYEEGGRDKHGKSYWPWWAFCSTWCARDSYTRPFEEGNPKAPFAYLAEVGAGVFSTMFKQDSYGGSYFFAHEFETQCTSPTLAASEYMSVVEPSLFLNDKERDYFARLLFDLANRLYHGRTPDGPE